MAEYNVSCFFYTRWVQESQITQTEFAIVGVLNGLTILPAVVLNALVLISIWRAPAFHIPAMVLLGNLALSDFAVGIIAQPAILIWSTLEFYVNEWPETYCRSAVAFGLTSSMFGGVSLLSVTSIAIDRFLALQLHLRYQTIVNMKRTVYICVVIWVISFSILAIWYFIGITAYNILTNSFILACVGIVFFSYFRIYKILRKHQIQIHAQEMNFSTNSSNDSASETTERSLNIKQYKKSVVNSLLVYFTFVICCTPCFCALTYFEITRDSYLSPKLVKISTSLVLVNSGINPVIYCWKMKELRTAVMQTLESIQDWLGRKKIKTTCERRTSLTTVVEF
ncbi:predicted protein [Nematostella vectensis]|uniref:G-protein coupled receptors family 1 profile domain-containing protein n=1 Tax=Nematostella vectensis TaxID=45351 RepID=A7S0V6_NEMVE|nr:predicted protein [Nematostella vectensis]|eukprot:XP_001634674.1 predicted protein [Nematostella vectensis]